MEVAGGGAHEVADHAAVVHLDERGAGGSLADALQEAVEGDVAGGCGHADGAGAGDGHDGAKRVGVVVVVVEEGAPVVDGPAWLDGHAAVDVPGVAEGAALVDVVVFGVHEVAEESLLPELAQEEVLAGEGVVLQQVVDLAALLDGLDDGDALGGREEGRHLAHDVLAGLQRLDGVAGVVAEEGGDEDGVEVLGEEVVLVVSHIGVRRDAGEVLAHHGGYVATGDDLDVERPGGVDEVEPASQAPDAQAYLAVGAKRKVHGVLLCVNGRWVGRVQKGTNSSGR